MADLTPIHIALAFDEKFWAPAYATARSIALGTHRRGDLVFHLCHPPLPDDAMADLGRLESEFGSKIVHHNIDDDANYVHFASTLPSTKYISAVTYARLMFDRILGEDVSRVIYFDCDMLVRAPVEELAEADLKGKPLAAVKDPHALRFSNGRDVNEIRDLLDPADPFFNAGMLVIDLAKWRETDLTGQLYAMEKDGTLGRLAEDQQMLNYIFKRNWTPLDPLWNAQVCGKVMEMLDPKNVHYTGPNKPWNLINGLPFARTYRHVMTNELFYRYWRYRMKLKLKRLFRAG